ncbi:MAG: HD domain-containing protein [bacterium]|nr:HD domain-containing protein [bacterium]
MRKIAPEEIIDYKILPFNIYSEFGEKIFSAGETLTPGKLLQLKHMAVLYRDDEDINIKQTEDETENQEVSFSVPSQDTQFAVPNEKPSENFFKQKQETNTESSFLDEEWEMEDLGGGEIVSPKIEKIETLPESPKPVFKAKTDEQIETENMLNEGFDMKPSTITRNKLSIDDIDVTEYKGPVNKNSNIDAQTQLKIKAFFYKTIDSVGKKSPLETLGMFANIRDKIVQDIILNSEKVKLSSQLKLLGEYDRCHSLNTAILSGAVARHMNLSETMIYNIVLAGLLHDIGKTKLPKELLMNNSSLTAREIEDLRNHTKIGYRMLRAEMDVPENIAQVARDHHEFNDGTGYPSGKSGESINTETQIIAVCNFFDNLTSNRTSYQIRNTKEALRVMLQMGTKKFSADALYTFVHMFSYNDTTNFEEMVQQH